MALEEMALRHQSLRNNPLFSTLQLKGHLQAHAQRRLVRVTGMAAHSDKSWSTRGHNNWVLIIRPAAGVLVHTCAHIHSFIQPTILYVASWSWKKHLSHLNKCQLCKCNCLIVPVNWCCFLKIIKAACGAAEWFYGHHQYCILFLYCALNSEILGHARKRCYYYNNKQINWKDTLCLGDAGVNVKLR